MALVCGTVKGLHKEVPSFEPVDEILKGDQSYEGYEHHFPVGLLIILYKAVVSFETVDRITNYDNSNESYQQYFSVVLFFSAAQGGSNFINFACG